MGGYFKFVGVVEMIGFVIGLIPMAMLLFPLIANVNFPFAFLYILAFISYIVFGPAFGLGFIYLGGLVSRA